jgi:hypothetical protein
MVEVPVKLEQTWSPISHPPAAASAARVMSSPEFSTPHIINLREFLQEEASLPPEEPSRFEEVHPGRRVGQV